MVYVVHGIGAAGASSSSSSSSNFGATVAAFATIAKAEAEKCFAATFLKGADDRQLVADVTSTTARAASEAKAKMATDPAAAKAFIDTAMQMVATTLPQIKDIGNVSVVQAAANAAKQAIDGAAAAEAAAKARRASSASASIPTTPALPLPDTSSGSSFKPTPVQIGLGVVLVALLVLPVGRKKS